MLCQVLKKAQGTPYSCTVSLEWFAGYYVTLWRLIDRPTCCNARWVSLMFRADEQRGFVISPGYGHRYPFAIWMPLNSPLTKAGAWQFDTLSTYARH